MEAGAGDRWQEELVAGMGFLLNRKKGGGVKGQFIILHLPARHHVPKMIQSPQ